MTKTALKPPNPVLTILLVLLGLGGVFYVYFLSITDHTRDQANPGLSQSAEKPTTVAHLNRTADRDTVVLIWAWPFGRQFQQRSCSSLYNISSCYLTDDRGLYEKADGVMFHHKEVQNNLLSLQRMPRPPRQKWVWMNMESPANSIRLRGPDNLFNLTSSYRRDSDVWVPYGWVEEASSGGPPFTVPKKDKLVCWIVKNWKEDFLRVKYFNELDKHVQVDTYGGHFGRNLSYWDYFKVLSTCKFYLSFENSIHKDYITEKLFNPMITGTVPVVLGPSRENYEEFIPADSFIHVQDFKTPKELAEYLKFLDQNQDMYERYFTWRKHFVARRADFGLEHACRICDHIKRNKGYRVFKNLNKWYWG